MRRGSRHVGKGQAFVCDDGGFTTVGVAVALLLVFALLFACLRAYWIGTRSGDIQYVADAGALAADDVVSDFVTVAQLVDAMLLSMTLLGVTVYAVSAVAAFIPGAEGFATRCVQLGHQVLSMRDRFAKSAIKGLNAAQRVLPALCAAKAAACIEANANAGGIDYHGFALAFPATGQEVELPDDGEVEEAVDDVESKEAQVEDLSKKVEQARKRRDAAKERAWRADCGGEGMTMRERAARLAGLSSARNPSYASPEEWSFSVALERAKAYYRARYAQEPGNAFQGSPEEVTESVARKRFYSYALETVSKGSVTIAADGPEHVDLKALARDTEQIKKTRLYTEKVYPVSSEGGILTIHSCDSCPDCAAGKPAGLASLADLDSGAVEECPCCRLRASTLGRVPAASTSISNGFEYYYRIVVEVARDYASEARKDAELARRLGQAREDIVEDVSKALEKVAALRYDPRPPGRYGCICIVVAPQTQATTSTSFLADRSSIGPRLAVSGATLAPDGTSNQADVITALAEGLFPKDSLGSGAARMIFGVWDDLLGAYASGSEGVSSALRSLLAAIPVVGNDLSDRVAGDIDGVVHKAGLEPADLKAYKPILVNTSHILSADSSPLARRLLKIKQRGNQVQGICSEFEKMLDGLGQTPDPGALLGKEGLTVATIPLSEFGFGISDVDVTMDLPAGLWGSYQEILAATRNALESAA